MFNLIEKGFNDWDESYLGYVIILSFYFYEIPFGTLISVF